MSETTGLRPQIEERGSTHVYRQIKMLSEEELVKRESLCVYEQPAYCVAACPLKLDAKAMLDAAAKGNFDRALQLYEKITPLPNILSAGCEAPCEGACKLCELGDGVAVRNLEQAIVRFGSRANVKGFLRMKKKQKIAVFGTSLFALFLTGELQKKNYPVTVYCREADVESWVLAAVRAGENRNGSAEAGENGAISEELAEAAKRDAALLSKTDVTFHFSVETDAQLIEAEREAYDVVCAALEAAAAAFPSLAPDEALMYDRGSGVVTGPSDGVLGSAYAAKRAALSVDRLAQKLDPTKMRGEEGPCETKLYTNTEHVTEKERVPYDDAFGGTGAYSREAAVQEAKRCIQCHCDECIKGCAYLQHYNKYPRILTREIYNNVGIIMGDHMMNKPINACSLCGQCTVTCPNGYDMAEICHLARQNMVSTDKMPLAPHEFALMDMLFSNQEAFLSRTQPGYETCKYVFFPGCQASAIAPGTVRAAYSDLCERLPGGVALMLGCCGAICDWAGRYEMYDTTKEFIDRELDKLGGDAGRPVVIAGCPTCKKELEGHGDIEVIGIWDFLLEKGLPDGAHGLDRPAALHDSCGARGDAKTQDAIRQIASQLGCTLVDTEYSGDRSPCCGYGGLTAYANREVAKEMTQKCLSRSDEPYISYCMACRDRFAREGRESRHILELVYGTDAGAPPDISEKRYNRMRLKNDLLKELWNEEVYEVGPEFEIRYTPEALQMMDDRMILKSDVIDVLRYMRESGEAILDADTGLIIARRRIGNATFWVKYTEEGTDSYLVRSAYSHRMNVVPR